MPIHRGIFFDMHGVLMDETALFPQYAQAQARLLAARFGGEESQWLAAYGRMMKEWQGIWRDLDLKAPDGVARVRQAWEKLARENLERAQATVSEQDVAWAVIELPREAARACRAAFPEVAEAVATLKGAGRQLAVASVAMSTYSRGLLAGSAIEAHFSAVFGPDNIGLAYKCPDYYQRAAQKMGLEPRSCAIVDDNLDGIAAAKKLGALAVLVDRGKALGELPGKAEAKVLADLVVPSLEGLAQKLEEVGG